MRIFGVLVTEQELKELQESARDLDYLLSQDVRLNRDDIRKIERSLNRIEFVIRRLRA